MSKQRKVVFEIHTSRDRQHFGKTRVGKEDTYCGETLTTKNNVLKTMRSTIKKIQAGLVEIVECNDDGEVIKRYQL